MGKFKVATYNPKNSNLILKGRNIESWADGDDTIKVTYPEAIYESKVGAKGEVAVNEIIDPRITIEISVWYNSEDREFLDSLAKDRNYFPVAFIDNNDYAESISGQYGRIKKKADRQQGIDNDKATYEIEVLDGDLE